MTIEGISLKKIFQSSAFLALIPAFLIIFFMPHPAARYSISIDGMIKFKGQHLYSDLNSDSITELIYSGREVPYYFIAAKDLNNHIYDQWNLTDSLSSEISEIFTGNYDNDNFSEIYIFTNRYDSLFLNINEMLEPVGKRTLLTDTSMENIIIAGNKLLVLDRDLSIKKTVDSPFMSDYQAYKADVNNDYIPEVILFSPSEEKIAVYNKKLKLKGIETVGFSANKLSFSYYNSKDVRHRLSVKAGDRLFFLSTLDNRYFWFDYLTYVGIYIFFLGFIFFVRKMNTLQIVHRENLKQRLVTLQLQGIKSQLDPHFTFNTLNSVASLIYLEDRETAYDYLNKFTILLRSMLNDAERIYRRLNEELEFVQTYLDLEKLRFGDKFDYRIDIGKGITLKEEVPKLVIQTFAENAVKHGILPSKDGGLVIISVSKSGDYLNISIEDNGIGRERSAGQSTSTGRGLKLTFEFYEILNQINKKQIRYTITDLHNNSGEPSGTRVDVLVPVS